MFLSMKLGILSVRYVVGSDASYQGCYYLLHRCARMPIVPGQRVVDSGTARE